MATPRITAAGLVAAVAIFVTSCGGPAPPPMKHVADVKQLMNSILEPAADEYWDAVGTIYEQSGTTEIRPQSAADWETIVGRAYVIAESGNLLMLGPRAKDGGEWMALSRALVDVGEKAIRAAEARNPQAVFDVGAEVYDACTNCHAKYSPEVGRMSGAQP